MHEHHRTKIGTPTVGVAGPSSLGSKGKVFGRVPCNKAHVRERDENGEGNQRTRQAVHHVGYKAS